MSLQPCFRWAGAFDTSSFLNGYYDDDCYFNIPMHYLPNMNDPWYLDRYRRNRYVLATGVHDQCWNDNERMAQVFREKNIPVPPRRVGRQHRA